MKEVGWLFGLGVLLMVGAWIVLPREEIGTLNYSVVNNCAVQIETEPNSPNTFLKAFTCSNYLTSGLNCYYLEMQGGICAKSIHYYKPPTETNQGN